MSPIKKVEVIEETLALMQGNLPPLDHFPQDVEQVLRYMHEHLFDETSNVDTIITCSHVQKATIYGRFKIYVGMSIREYWEDRRMRTAMRLLRIHELEIYLVAHYVGYANYTSFARAFRRHFGQSPKVYREKMLRENV